MKKSIKFRYGMNASIITVLFVVIVIFVNLLASVIADKFPGINVDLSENQQFSLSKETKEALKDIKKDVKVTVVLRNKTRDAYYDEFLNRYKEVLPQMETEYVDPVKNPSAIKEFSDDIDPNGSFIIRCGERSEVMDAMTLDGQNGRMEDAESLFTNAIVSLSSEEKKFAKFTTGHGEPSFDGLKKIFENKYFDVSDVDLKTGDIGKCDILVIAAPDQDFTQQELQVIDEFSKKGGAVQIYLNPEAQYLPLICQYITEWGIEVKNEIVKENNSANVFADYNGYIPVRAENDFTAGVSDSYPLLYEPAYRLEILYSGTKSVTISEVLKTTDKATTVTGATENPETGAYHVALVSEKVLNDNSNTYLFVSGSTINLRYPYETISGLPANKQLANSVLSKMTGTGSYIEISSKKSQLKAFRVTLSQVVFIAIVVVLAALGLIIAGVIIWRKRRFL